MASSNRWRIVGLCFLMALLAAWGTLAAAAAPANGPAALTAPLAAVKAAPAAQPAEDEPPLIGYPCGDGAQPLPWTICLYGYFLDGDKAVNVSSGIPVTVTYYNEATGQTGVKSTVTRVRPGESVAAYALDISSLKPDYMGEVELTIEGYGTYKVIVNPDMRTQNLRFDVPVGAATGQGRAAAAPPPDGVWGYVVDFEHNAPIADVVVTISSGQGDAVVSLNTTTADGAALPEPYYAFSKTDLDKAKIDLTQPLLVEAQYNRDRVARVVQPPAAGQAEQVNLFTGWMCDTEDGRDLLPQVGSDTGAPPLPETTGADGLPDMGCFWGYVDGTNGEEKDVTVHLEVAGRAYEDKTFVFKLDATDGRPRYGIVVPEVEQIAGQPLTVTAVLSGSVATHTTTVALDAAHSQRIDLQLDVILGEGTLRNNGTSSIVRLGDFIYAGTQNGLVRFDAEDETSAAQRVADGPGAAPVSDVTLDKDSCLWLVSRGQVYRYCPLTGEWWEFDAEETGANVTAIAAGEDRSVWFGNEAGELHVYRAGSQPEWAAVAVESFGSIDDLSISPAGIVWAASYYYTLGRLDPSDEPPRWRTVSLDTDLSVREIKATVQGAWARRDHLDSGQDELGYVQLLASGELSYTTKYADACGEYEALDIDAAQNPWLVCRVSIDSSEYARVVKYDVEASLWTTVAELALDNSLSRFDWMSMALDLDEAHGHFWLGTLNRADQVAIPSGVRLRQVTWEHLGLGEHRFPQLGDVEATSDAVYTIVEEDDVWNLDLYHADTMTFGGVVQTWPIPEYRGPATLVRGEDGRSLWVARPGSGVSHYTPGAADPWVDYVAGDDKATGLISDTVYAMATHQGSTFFATFAGVSVYTPGSQPEWQAYEDKILADETYVEGSMLADSVGNVWLHRNGDLLIYLKAADAWHACNTGAADSSPSVLDIDLDPGSDTIWASVGEGNFPDRTYKLIRLRPSREGCERAEDADAADIDAFPSVAVDHSGDVWVHAYNDSRCRVYETQTGHWLDLPIDFRCSSGTEIAANLNRDTMIIATLASEGPSTLTYYSVPAKHPDLVLSLSTPNEGITDTLPYTLTVANTGVRPATATALTLDLPPGVTFAAATCDRDGPVVTCAPTGSDPLTWALGDLAPQQVVTVTVSTTVNDPAPVGATLAATAAVTTIAAEAYTLNNAAGPTATLVRDIRPDARVAIIGPEQFTPGKTVVLTVRADNVGGSALNNATVRLQLGPHLSSDDDLTWTIDSLPPSDPATGQAEVNERTITVRVAANAPPNTQLAVSATIDNTDDNTDDPHPADNTARLTLPTTLQNVTTLILVADAQMEQAYGAGGVMEAVYRLAAHPKVNGLVVDVTADPTTAAAYALWNQARACAYDPEPPADCEEVTDDLNEPAQQVAEAIHGVIDDARADHPTIAYVVIIGGDHIIPFYRIEDQSATGWRESDYAAATLAPGTTVYEALSAGNFLTDDCYTDQQPTPITAPGWASAAGLCQPELPTGRLVETPAEIAAAIDAFIAIDGEIRLVSAVVGSTAGNNDAESGSDDARLTLDLDDDQCRILRQAGLNPRCRQSNKKFRDSVLATPFTSLWGAQHSSHYGAGDLRSSDVQAATADFAGRLLATIGCHAGLSAPPRPPTDADSIDYDMAQAWLDRGGTLIGGAAYGFGSKVGIGYSEFYLQALTRELTRGASAEVGAAVLRAKQVYVTRHMPSFTHLDEKVVLPITLYGLPMLRVRTPNPTGTAAPAASGVRLTASTVILPITPVDATLFQPHSTASGAYQDYNGGVFEQVGRPVEPAHDVEVPVTLQGHTVRGVLLRSATFTTTVPFVPYRGQPWALSAPMPRADEEDCARQDPPDCRAFLPIAAGLTVAPTWDHMLPFTFGVFGGGDEASAYVFTILGAYNEATGEWRRYNHLALDVVYGLGDDAQPATFAQNDSYTAYGGVGLAVRANDADGIGQVVGLCEYAAAGRLESVDLRWNGARWVGRCPALGDVTRTLVQVVDGAGNVTISDWQTPPTATLSGPDLSIESVVATRDGIEIVIRNVGTVAVTPAQSFWVDAYLKPGRPPSAVNERWDDLADYGAAWEVFLTIAPGEAVTLRTGDGQMHPAYSRLPERLPVGAAVYAHVDVWNDATAYGAAEETHEMAAGPYNNIFGPVEVGGTNRATDAAPAVNTAPGTAPARPEVMR